MKVTKQLQPCSAGCWLQSLQITAPHNENDALTKDDYCTNDQSKDELGIHMSLRLTRQTTVKLSHVTRHSKTLLTCE